MRRPKRMYFLLQILGRGLPYPGNMYAIIGGGRSSREKFVDEPRKGSMVPGEDWCLIKLGECKRG